MSKTDRRVIDKVFILLGMAMTAVLIIAGFFALYGYHFATSSVKSELAQQQIFFPARGSAAITALPQADQIAMGKYAGQQLINGEQAKVYADNFINVHLNEIAGGKTYAQVSSLAMENPNNQTLQTQKSILFQGETLRGLLLGSGYAYWTFGMIALYVSILSFIGAAVMGFLVLLGLRHLSKIKT
jgi:hypothetical protein